MLSGIVLSEGSSLKRSASKKSLRRLRDDDDDDDDDDESNYSRTSDDNSDRRSKRKSRGKHRSKDRKRDGREKSMRQARSLIQDSKRLEDFDETAQTNMTNEMAKLVADLKRQKDEMEAKLKAVEDEKSALKLTMESNLREADKKVANAELDVVKKEKQEMAKMIEQLERTKAEMEENLRKAKEEANTLKERQFETVTQVEEMLSERERLRQAVYCGTVTRRYPEASKGSRKPLPATQGRKEVQNQGDSCSTYCRCNSFGGSIRASKANH